MKLFTIGFTKKSAEKFFNLLCSANVKRIVDIRLKNESQLAGFAKKNDLKFFLKNICGIDYIHIPELAPTKEILEEYKKYKGDWDNFENKFSHLLKNRDIETAMKGKINDNDCLLCSEHDPEQCHRKIVANYFVEIWRNIEIKHLV